MRDVFKNKLLAILLSGFSAIAAAAPVSINFDGTGAPGAFASTTPLTNLYTPLGVTFSGIGGAGGSILNQSGNFGYNAHSGTDFLAFNGSLTVTSELIDFTGTTDFVSLWIASSTGSAFTMTATDDIGNVIDTITVNGTTQWQQVSVSGAGIGRVTLMGPRVFTVDDLQFNAVAAEVPEPGSLALLGLGLAGLAASVRRRKSA